MSDFSREKRLEYFMAYDAKALQELLPASLKKEIGNLLLEQLFYDLAWDLYHKDIHPDQLTQEEIVEMARQRLCERKRPN